MFKKIVSQLSFSPALVGQLAFYARRLRKEEATRRLGLIFVALALVVQSLVVFQAPEPANASNPGDMIPGGLGLGSARSFNNFLGPYDRNERHLQDIYNYFGITRDEITATHFATFTVGDKIGWGFENRAGAKAVSITDGNFQPVTTLYGRPLNIMNSRSDQIWGYLGHSSKIGWFAIMQYCGNLITDIYPTPPTPPPAPANIIASKKAVNSTQKIDASKKAAQANDKITYTITAQNTGGTAKVVDFSDNLKSVLQYAKLIDNGGGTYNASIQTLKWPSVNVEPGATISHSYTVQMNSTLISKTTDCSMTNNFTDKTVTVPVGCVTPPAKIELSKTATNVSQGNVNATTVTAKAKDRITFTLTAQNSGGTAKDFTFEDTIGDTLEYSRLIDAGGGSFNSSSRILSWPVISLKPGEKQVRVFSVQLLDTIPATPKGISDASSYDCRIENTFYDTSVVFSVDCPAPKVIETVVPELPHTGPTENIIFAGVVLAIVAFFYFRARQLGTEVRLIRRDINGGTL
ncbi:hypothetical protein BGO18_00860 [Candidatus Saccharibacteria bacterium 47-87]|jgi:uncharacterized repeat protein (TIGR01451 family)|nr:DUF11 domain-containing protein [Candidatus Saccharibacteria bacterium]OJU96723.1 MAG: hypothetical protein BGO18_00860 [Candidatus Saccharibacteria bacterium 47-87]